MSILEPFFERARLKEFDPEEVGQQNLARLGAQIVIFPSDVVVANFYSELLKFPCAF